MTVCTSIFLVFFILMPTFAAGATGPQTRFVPSSSPVQLHDIKDVITLPAPIPWWYWLSGALILLLGFVLVFWMIKKQKNKEKLPSAGEQALAALESARDLMSPDQARSFAVKLAEILRTYIEEQFHLFRPNLTTREFLQALTQKTDMKNSTILAYDDLLKDWLIHCDMVKFARYTLTVEEMEQMVVQIREFIEKTGKTDTPENGRQKQ